VAVRGRREARAPLDRAGGLGTPAPVAARRIKRARLLATSAVACALAAVGVGAWAWRVQTRVQGDRPLVHFQIPVAAPSDPFRFAVSPDGRRLAYVMAGEDGKDRLWLRPLDALAAQAIPGTEYATTPFWSPDGRHVAFASSGRLKRTDLDGGEPQPICDLPPGMAGGTWSRDGVIVFGTFPGHLYRVAATGGTPVPLLARHGGRSGGSTIRLRPHFLPDGKRFVFVDLSRDEPSPGIWLGSLDEAEPPRRLLDVPSAAAYAPEGHLLFARAGTLFARPFDVQKAAFTGESFPVVDGVGQDVNLGIAAFSVSQTGVLAYRPPSPAREQLVWFDRAGARLGTLGEPGRHSNFDLAADGTKVAVSIPDPRTGLGALWTIDVTRGVTTLVASSERESFEDPVWAPDGTRIAATTRRARPAIVAKPVRGGEVALLFEAENAVGIVEDWSADGRHLALLLVQDRNPVQRGGLLSLEEKGQPQLLEPELGATDELRFSPDGRWLAFAASPGGRWEIFVTTVPPRGERWQISTAGGMQPRWSRDGKELFYLAPDGTLMAVEVKTTAAKAPGAKLEAGMPRPLFATGLQPRTGYDQYAVAPDGRRFLLNVPIPTPTQPPIGVIVNWSAAFKR
jgi:Tol biopolymer transport system component